MAYRKSHASEYSRERRGIPPLSGTGALLAFPKVSVNVNELISIGNTFSRMFPGVSIMDRAVVRRENAACG
jgi:hypothetical protein